MTVRIAIVGLGKIARDQHIPAILASDRFTLVAAATHEGMLDDVPVFGSVGELLASGIACDALAMCQPPQARFADAQQAIQAGKHVLLEKPPGATLSEVEALTRLADAAGTTLFAAWHSRFASGVDQAREWLSKRRIRSVEIIWKEDVRRWHPGQQWIWQPGGLGVFDPGINALSIATAILPEPLSLSHGKLEVPANRETPIAADLHLVGMGGAPVHAVFDWRQQGPQTWDIVAECDEGTLRLTQGGAALEIAGQSIALERQSEYANVYDRFARLIAEGCSDVDRTPLRLVAAAFMRCDTVHVDAFDD